MSLAFSISCLLAASALAQVFVAPEEGIRTYVGADTWHVGLGAVSRRACERLRDSPQILVVFTGFSAHQAPFYEPVRNDVRGLGLGQGGLTEEFFDEGERFGCPGLEGVVLMGQVQAATVTLLAQEVAHRYGAYVSFLVTDGVAPSLALLSTDGAHWSPLLETGGSPLGGNRWVAADGLWVSGDPTESYAPIDLYLMGLMGPEEVGPLALLVPDDPQAASLLPLVPQADLEVAGHWLQLGVEEIVAANGPRHPVFDGSARTTTMAWAYVGEENAGAMAPVEAFWLDWVAHYGQVTAGRGEVESVAVQASSGAVLEASQGCSRSTLRGPFLLRRR